MTRTTIGKFQLRELLGRGATASVYLAEDPFTNAEVAIKIAHPNVMDDPESGYRFKKMFMNEASLAGKLRHPHIVSVYDAGIEQDVHYIVMEYVPGETLKEVCKPDKLLPTDDVIEIIFKCSNALEHAFLFGLIHRDIKPGNLLTTGGTEVKVSDFGTALLTNSDLTQVMDAVGTPSYMSPEQLSNQPLTQQTDIYSLGVVMYQMLSGKLPYSATNQFELIQKITHQPPVPLESVRSGLPESVIAIVNRCLKHDLKERYSNWAEVARDLALAHEQLNISSSVEASDSRKFNILKGLKFFHEFTDVELWEMLRISKWRYFKGAKTLLEEGKIGGSIFILASGDARIMKNDAFLGVVDTGQCFGEMAYIHGTKKCRTASVVSNSPVTVIKIKSEALQQASIELQTKFNRELLRTLAERLEKTSIMASSI